MLPISFCVIKFGMVLYYILASHILISVKQQKKRKYKMKLIENIKRILGLNYDQYIFMTEDQLNECCDTDPYEGATYNWDKDEIEWSKCK